jgi:hypothetical protein
VPKRTDASETFGNNKILKEKPMFKTFSTLTLLGLLTLSAAHAQSSQPIRAKVPFDFTVQNTTLEAGNYQLTYSSTSHALSIRGLGQNSASITVTAQPVGAPGSSNGPGKLVFECAGGTCYLARVWQSEAGGDRGLRVVSIAHAKALAAGNHLTSVTIPAE